MLRSGEYCHGASMNVLIVENTKLYQQILVQLFEASGVTPQLAANARQALELAERERFDLVCASRQLPDMDGLALLKRLRSTGDHGQVTAILITVDDSDQATREGFAAGFTDVLNKAKLNTIQRSIEHLVERFDTKLHGKVLYLEDSPSVAAMTKSILEEMGLVVDHFTNGEAGLAVFDDINYDMVITDVVLEGSVSGVGVVNHVRKADGDKARTPVLAISGSDDVSRRVELLRLGANDYVSKPIQQDEFAARVSNLIHYKQLFDQVRAHQQQLQKMATTDNLTGLFNRHSLSEFGPKYISDAYRHDTALSLLVVDLDHFKSINDTYGHATGDQVLENVGDLLKAQCRNEDMAARFGGEEFVVILSHCSLKDAQAKAEALRAKMEALHPAGLTVTPSIGVVSLPKDPHVDFEGLFKCADEAVYAAKHGGRNQVRTYDGDFDEPHAESAVSS